jgi:hypothetical protein
MTFPSNPSTGEVAASWRASTLALAALAALTALTSCAGGRGDERRASPAPRAESPPDTTETTLAELPDLSQVPLTPVPGRVRTVVDVRPGQASLHGVVVGPEGPVPGAVVRAERLVGDSAAGVETAGGADGRWSIGGVKGGRYRVRAWRPPDLTLLQPEVLFLAARESRDVDLVLERRGPMGAAAIAPNPPLVNQPANLAVRIVQQAVDQRGILRARPLAAVHVQLTGGGRWEVRSANPTVTDGGGVARWEVMCLAPGPQGAAVVITGTTISVSPSVPACR